MLAVNVGNLSVRLNVGFFRFREMKIPFFLTDPFATLMSLLDFVISYLSRLVFCYNINSELPRVMAIYDILGMGEANLRRKIRSHFYAHANVKDDRVIGVLIEKGYIDLEETLLQYKQKTHLMLLLESINGTHQNIKALNGNASIDEQFLRIG
jgi:hypothetical protein